MATQTSTTVIDHTSDAGFRAWVTVISNALAGCGLVQTADTGQINLLTATRPAINSLGGYQNWRFNDSQQGTSPIVFRIEYRTGTQAQRPQIAITVGTGSNGSGTITGLADTSRNIVYDTFGLSAATPVLSRFCAVDGCFWFIWGHGAGQTNSPALAYLSIHRYVDDTGAATADGFRMYSSSTNGGSGIVNNLEFRIADAAIVSNTTGTTCLVHGGVSSSLTAGAAQVYKHYSVRPRVRPNPYVLTVLASEFGNNTTFTTTVVGVTSRTYVSSGTDGVKNTGVCLPASTSYCLANIWE